MRTLSLSLIALCLALAAQASAANCPSPSDISQKEEGQGYAYSAMGGWAGENPVANEDDLKSFQFVGAKITEGSVICRYEGEGDGGTSLAMKASKRATGSSWNKGECTASVTSACPFE